MLVSTVWSVSCLLFFYSRCPRSEPFVKVGDVSPCPLWSWRHVLLPSSCSKLFKWYCYEKQGVRNCSCYDILLRSNSNRRDVRDIIFVTAISVFLILKSKNVQSRLDERLMFTAASIVIVPLVFDECINSCLLFLLFVLFCIMYSCFPVSHTQHVYAVAAVAHAAVYKMWRMQSRGGLGCLALARWAGWSGVQVGRYVTCWSTPLTARVYGFWPGTKQLYAALVCRLMVPTPVIHGLPLIYRPGGMEGWVGLVAHVTHKVVTCQL